MKKAIADGTSDENERTLTLSTTNYVLENEMYNMVDQKIRLKLM